MTTYKEIVGTSVTNIAGDSPATVDGDVWYDSTNKAFKFNLTTTFTGWTTGGNLTTGRDKLGGAGTQTAGLAIAGDPATTAVEEYNTFFWRISSFERYSCN